MPRTERGYQKRRDAALSPLSTSLPSHPETHVTSVRLWVKTYTYVFRRWRRWHDQRDFLFVFVLFGQIAGKYLGLHPDNRRIPVTGVRRYQDFCFLTFGSKVELLSRAQTRFELPVIVKGQDQASRRSWEWRRIRERRQSWRCSGENRDPTHRQELKNNLKSGNVGTI